MCPPFEIMAPTGPHSKILERPLGLNFVGELIMLR